MALTAQAIINALTLLPHPEGGHYAETFRDPRQVGGRAASTAIIYLLQAGERSQWHRVDAAEVWHHYAGDPLELCLSEDGHATTTLRLGPNLLAGERPQRVVGAGVWQSATSLGAFTLAGCTVSPGFRFEGLEMAPPGWEPG
jgi:uncharacterized protein